MKLSESGEDYLRAVHALEERDGRVSTKAVAERVGVSAPSATSMLKRLAALGLVRHEPYRGVSLTRKGRRTAVELVRHHRLLEQYLVESLGVSIDRVHVEADRLEHALSEELEARIDARLGYPTHDPHGDPIPNAELELASSRFRSLGDLVPGEQATIRRIPDEDAEVLRYLAELELVPGQVVQLLSSAPFGGPLVVLAAGSGGGRSRALATLIGVG